MTSSPQSASPGSQEFGQRVARVRVDVANLTLKEAVFLQGVIDLLTDPANWPAREMLADGSLVIHAGQGGLKAGPAVSRN